MSAPLIRILGIDPGLRRTGWGVVDVAGNRLIFVACGCVETNERDDVAARLVVIHQGLARVLAEHRPHEAAVEATFVNKNASATLKLGQARGVALLANTRPTWSRKQSSVPATARRRRSA
jgi:crossover junction endodeoxyribonuclease RuvC